VTAADWAVGVPHPAVRHLVARYIGYAQHGVALRMHRGLPSRHLTVIIGLARPVTVVGMPTPGDTAVREWGLVGGMHLAPALIAQDEVQSGIQLELEPFGALALLGVSSVELSGRVVGLGDLGSPQLAVLPERLAEAPDWTSRFRILDTVLRALSAGRVAHVPPEVRWAWRALAVADGRVRVTDLADEVGWSRRHFSERFRAAVGLTPKQAARVLRFERATRLLRRGRADLATLAADCGYYDQAHFGNEWRALAGCSPGVWMAEELPFLQDGVGFGGEDSVS